jgi:hypothetical protein
MQKNPGKSVTDYKRARAGGVGGSTVGDDLLQAILSQDLSDDMMSESISSAFGVDIQQADILRNAGTLKPDSRILGKEGKAARSKGQTLANDTLKRGVGVNDVTKSSAVVTDGFAKLGVGAVDLANTFLNSGEAVKEMVDDLSDSVKEFGKDLSTASSMMADDIASDWRRIKNLLEIEDNSTEK